MKNFLGMFITVLIVIMTVMTIHDINVRASVAPKYDRIVIVYSDDLCHHIESDVENIMFNCCVKKIASNEAKIRSLFIKKDKSGTPISQSVDEAIVRIPSDTQVIILSGNDAFSEIGIKRKLLTSGKKVVYINVDEDVVEDASKAGIPKESLVGNYRKTDLKKVEELFHYRNIVLNGNIILYTSTKESISALKSLQSALKDKPVEKILVNDENELRMIVANLNKKEQSLLINTVDHLWSRDKGKFIDHSEIAQIIVSHNKKHAELTVHESTFEHGYMLTLAHSNVCVSDNDCFGVKTNVLTESLTINRSRAEGLGFHSLFESLEYIDYVY